MARRQRDHELLRQLGRRLQQARTDRGWTQEQLAEAIEVDPVSISRYETGARALSLSTINTIAGALEVSLGDLLDAGRELPEPTHDPETEELLRLFSDLTPSQRDLLLRLAREFAP